MVSVPAVALVSVYTARPAPLVTTLALWFASGPLTTLKLTVVPCSGFADPSSTVAVTFWATPLNALCAAGLRMTEGLPGGGGEVGPVTWTLSKAAVLNWPMSCPVSNSPIVTGPVMVRVVLPILVQLTPSADNHDVKVLPTRCSSSHLLG